MRSSTQAEVQAGPRNALVDRVERLTKFGLVGATGLAVNTAALFAFSGLLGLHYLVGVVLATQVSTVWNFVLSDWWVFGDRAADRSKTWRFGVFWTMNNGALLARGPMIYALTDLAGVHYLISNIASLVVIMLLRYGLSDFLIWRQTPRTDLGPPVAQQATTSPDATSS